jgi:phytoene dehydrogenase-like protein
LNAVPSSAVRLLQNLLLKISQADSVYAGGTLRPDIIKDLKLASHGLTVDTVRKPAFISLQADGNHLTLDAESIKHSLKKMRRAWNEFVRFMDKAASILDAPTPPSCRACRRIFNLRDGYGLLELGLELRLAGSKDMLNFIRALPMSAQELLDEYFESEMVKAAIASVGDSRLHAWTDVRWDGIHVNS